MTKTGTAERASRSRAWCPVCRADVHLRKDGTIMEHRNFYPDKVESVLCEGSGQKTDGARP